jgi:hypothetical protein
MKPKDSNVDLNRQLEAYAIASPLERNPQNRWGKWPIYAAATGAALAVASAASADIIYSGPINVSGKSLRISVGSHTIGFGVDTDVQRRFVPSTNLLEEFASVFAGNHVAIIANGAPAINFPTGAPISGSVRSGARIARIQSIFTRHGHGISGGGAGYNFGGFVGFELVGTNGFGVPTGSVEPGWIQVVFTASLPGSFDVTGWAYNTDGPINAGQTSATTPEPSYLPLMLLAAGVLAWKRNRRPQAPNA